MVTRYLPGDILMRRKGLVIHKGIALRNGMVLHNTPIAGEHVSTESEFRQGQTLYVERLSSAERRRTARAADSQERRGYHLLENNCEHTVSRARTGKPTSPQLAAWTAGLGAGALALAVTRKPSVAAAAFAFGASVGPRAAVLLDAYVGKRR